MAGASWYDSSWTRRTAIAVDLTAGGSGSIVVDVTLTIPADYDVFWDNVLASGADIRITDADGVTLETYQRQTWTHASQSGVLECDDVTLTDGRMNVLYLYWGNSGASDVAGSFTASSAKTGTIDMGAPAWPLVRALPEQPGVDRPRTRLSKFSADQLWVWWDFAALLQQRIESRASSLALEGLSTVQTVQVTTGGSAQAGMVDLTETRFIEPRIGRSRGAVVKTLLKAGADGTDYTVEVAAATTLGRIITARAWLLVRDVDEA